MKWMKGDLHVDNIWVLAGMVSVSLVQHKQRMRSVSDELHRSWKGTSFRAPNRDFSWIRPEMLWQAVVSVHSEQEVSLGVDLPAMDVPFLPEMRIGWSFKVLGVQRSLMRAALQISPRSPDRIAKRRRTPRNVSSSLFRFLPKPRGSVRPIIVISFDLVPCAPVSASFCESGDQHDTLGGTEECWTFFSFS